MRGVADFWVSRVNSTGNGRYKLLSIMGPDEWHRMDGEAYNTALASLCLKYAVETAAMVAPDQLHSSRVAHWGEVSKGLSVPITADGHHQTYDNYSGEAIMQPAVADLGYGHLNYRTAAPTLFLRPYLAHFCSFFLRFFAVLSVSTRGTRKVAPKDRGPVPQRSKTAGKRVVAAAL